MEELSEIDSPSVVAFTYGRAKSCQGFLKQELSCHLGMVVLEHNSSINLYIERF